MAKDGHLGKRSATLGLRVALCYDLRKTGGNGGGKGEGVGTPPLLADGEGGLVVEDYALLGEGGDGRVAVGGDV